MSSDDTTGATDDTTAAAVGDPTHDTVTAAPVNAEPAGPRPVTLVLDEAALIGPAPEEWTADLGGRGVTIHTAARSTVDSTSGAERDADEAVREQRAAQRAARRAERQAEREAAARRVEEDVIAAARADPADAYTAEVAADILDHRGDAARRRQWAAQDAVTAARAAVADAEQAGSDTTTVRRELADAVTAYAGAHRAADRAVAEMDAQNTVWNGIRAQAQDPADRQTADRTAEDAEDADGFEAYQRWGFASEEEAAVAADVAAGDLVWVQSDSGGYYTAAALDVVQPQDPAGRDSRTPSQVKADGEAAGAELERGLDEAEDRDSDSLWRATTADANDDSDADGWF